MGYLINLAMKTIDDYILEYQVRIDIQDIRINALTDRIIKIQDNGHEKELERLMFEREKERIERTGYIEFLEVLKYLKPK